MRPNDVIIHTEPETYIEAVQSFLECNEAENGLFLGVLGLLRQDPPKSTPFMAEAVSGGETVCAAIFRDRNLVITRGPEAAWPMIAEKLKETGTNIPGVFGPAVEAEWMAAAWAQVRGSQASLAIDHRLIQTHASELA